MMSITFELFLTGEDPKKGLKGSQNAKPLREEVGILVVSNL